MAHSRGAQDFHQVPPDMIPFLMLLPILTPVSARRSRSAKRPRPLAPVQAVASEPGPAAPRRTQGARVSSRSRRLPAQVLGTRDLNRALLQRQWLLRRSGASVPEALEHLVGLQAQATHPPYYGLWTRLEGFQRETLTRLLTERQVVRTAMMRATLHLVTARDCRSLRPVLQPALERVLKHSAHGKKLAGVEMQALVAEGRALLAERPSPRGELGQRLQEKWPHHDANALGMGVTCLSPLVVVPPCGTWGRGERTVYTTAESWLGEAVEPTTSLDALVLRYLAAFGPASVKDLQVWSGLPRLREVVERLRSGLRIFRDADGAELFDIPDAQRPAGDTPAPVRFLPEFDNVLLSHANRTRILSDAARQRIFTVNGRVLATFLVDGFVKGTWTLERERDVAALHITPFSRLSREDRAALMDEGARLLAFAAHEARRIDIRFARAG
ncbi:winged helix DNA-binding domain-containing protein [Myxococcus sp. Y35]|uniref:winged helix DNA-binding domain-containing protein n=1 Tax=Pseudomyxococcus flavus TaxID=3115648 RepID=UPI003CF21C55